MIRATKISMALTMGLMASSQLVAMQPEAAEVGQTKRPFVQIIAELVDIGLNMNEDCMNAARAAAEGHDLASTNPETIKAIRAAGAAAAHEGQAPHFMEVLGEADEEQQTKIKAVLHQLRIDIFVDEHMTTVEETLNVIQKFCDANAVALGQIEEQARAEQ